MVERQAVAENPSGGSREAQRRRTRRAIVEAAQRLISAGGPTPSVDDVAAEADVSRRTIYTYFPTLDQLLVDATAGLLSAGEVEPALVEGGDPRARVDALVAALHEQSVATLPLGRQMLRFTVDRPADPAGGRRRGYRRVEWLERAVEPVRAELGEEAAERLVSALCVLVGWEAAIVLEDIRGLRGEESAGVVSWAARLLVDAALDEAAQRDAALREAAPGATPPSP